MLTYEDCLGLCDLTEAEIHAIATHEHLPELVALELGQYLAQTPDGRIAIKKMIVDDIAAAETAGRHDQALKLKATMQHFIRTHPENPAHAG